MTSILRTLLLAAVALMATSAKASDLPGGPPSCPGLGGRVTRFVCAHCTATGLLSSRRLFQVLNRGAVRRHIAAAKLGPCRAADMGFREIHAEARPNDVMAGGGGAGDLRRTSDTSL